MGQDRAGARSSSPLKCKKAAIPIYDKRQEALAEISDARQAILRELETRNARAGTPSCHTLEAQRELDRDILPKLGRIRAEAVTRRYCESRLLLERAALR
jgi:hypothetical protein